MSNVEVRKRVRKRKRERENKMIGRDKRENTEERKTLCIYGREPIRYHEYKKRQGQTK